MADKTLAELVREKFPGAYDDVSDRDLENAVRAKFPGVYDDLPRSGATMQGAASGATGLRAASWLERPIPGTTAVSVGGGPSGGITPMEAIERLPDAVAVGATLAGGPVLGRVAGPVTRFATRPIVAGAAGVAAGLAEGKGVIGSLKEGAKYTAMAAVPRAAAPILARGARAVARGFMGGLGAKGEQVAARVGRAAASAEPASKMERTAARLAEVERGAARMERQLNDPNLLPEPKWFQGPLPEQAAAPAARAVPPPPPSSITAPVGGSSAAGGASAPVRTAAATARTATKPQGVAYSEAGMKLQELLQPGAGAKAQAAVAATRGAGQKANQVMDSEIGRWVAEHGQGYSAGQVVAMLKEGTPGIKLSGAAAREIVNTVFVKMGWPINRSVQTAIARDAAIAAGRSVPGGPR